ncbi:MAG: GH-E family nuclease [Pseudolysinimonas sp.]
MQQRLIDPDQIPGRSVIPDNVASASDALFLKAKAIGDGGTAVVQAWGGLSAVYSADGATALYSAMGPVDSASERLGTALRRVARAFDDYANTARGIVRDAEYLAEEARLFVRTAHAFTPRVGNPEDFWVGFGFGQTYIEHWYEDPAMNRANNSLIGRAYLIGERLREAADRCAADIRAAGNLWSADVVVAATKVPDQVDAPWGASGDRQESCAEKGAVFVPHLFGGLLGGLGDLGSSLGALVFGYDFRSWPPPQFQMLAGVFTGQREDGYLLPGSAQENETFGAAWLGIGHLVTGLVLLEGAPIYSEVIAPQLRAWGWDAGFVDGTQQWMRDSSTATANLVTGLVGYEVPDKWWDAETWDGYNGFQGWVDDPGGQAGHVGFNILSMFIPVKGGGAIAHGLEAVGDGARLADDAAEAAVRGGTRLVDGVAVVVRHGEDLGVVVDDVAGVGAHSAHDLADLRGTRPVDDLGSGADDLARRGDESPPPSHPAHEAPDASPAHPVDDPPPSHPADDVPPHGDPVDEVPAEHPDGDVPSSGGDVPEGTYPTGHLAEHGEPNSYGYDANGDRLPYANHRPDYAPEQVERVWRAARENQIREIELGTGDDLPSHVPRPDQLWVKDIHNEWKLIEWRSGEARTGIWDMGHTGEAKYSTLREQYLSHQIKRQDFLDEYRKTGNYRPEDPLRNRSHIDE